MSCGPPDLSKVPPLTWYLSPSTTPSPRCLHLPCVQGARGTPFPQTPHSASPLPYTHRLIP